MTFLQTSCVLMLLLLMMLLLFFVMMMGILLLLLSSHQPYISTQIYIKSIQVRTRYLPTTSCENAHFLSISQVIKAPPPPLPEVYSSEATALARWMLQKDPTRRPTLAQVSPPPPPPTPSRFVGYLGRVGSVRLYSRQKKISTMTGTITVGPNQRGGKSQHD